MSVPGCAICRKVRLVVMCVLLGGGGGLAVAAAGGSQTWSMLATFVGAIVPLMWWARRNRPRNGRS